MIYLFKSKKNGQIIDVMFEVGRNDAEAFDTMNRKDLYGEREFEYLGCVVKQEYIEEITKLKQKVALAISEISKIQKSDDGESQFNIVPKGKEWRMKEIRENEKKAYQIVLQRLSEKAKKIYPQKSEWTYLDPKAKIAIEGGLKNIML